MPAIQEIELGQSIDFGAFSMNQFGIMQRRGGSLLPWHRLKDLQFRDGYVIIYATEQSASWAMEKSSGLANIEIFRQLVRYYAGVR